MKRLILNVITVILFSLSSCTNDSKEIAATINKQPIYLADIDRLVEQELFDELNRIYYIKKYALDIRLKQIVVEKEAEQRRISIDSLKQRVISGASKKLSMEGYMKICNIGESFPQVRRTYESVKSDSEQGKRLILKKYHKFLFDKFVDSLMKNSIIEVQIKAPKRPLIQIDDERYVFYKGNVHSKVEFVLISDLECSRCIENRPLIDSIYNEYKNRVKFGFVNYSSYVSPMAMAVLSASKQGKYWEMHSFIESEIRFKSTKELMLCADSLGMDVNRFRKDINSDSLKKEIEECFLYLRKKGVDATPTILINGVLIYNSTSRSEIEEVLSHELQKLTKN